jgi:pilus assembly protein CpaE
MGEPFILSNSRSPLGKAVWGLSEKLSEKVSETEAEKKKEKRWFLIGN